VAGAELAVTLVWAIHAMCWLPELTSHVALLPKHERRHPQSRATRQSTLALGQCGGDDGAGLCVSRAGLRVPGKEFAGLQYDEDDSAVLGPWAICVVFCQQALKGEATTEQGAAEGCVQGGLAD
jgi:hypothetical protein